MQQLAGTRDGFARESCPPSGGGRPAAVAGLGQRFGEQEDVGRSRAGHRRHRVHQRFVVDPFDGAGRSKQTMRQLALRFAGAHAAPRR